MKLCTWGDICTLEYGKGLRGYASEPDENNCFRVFGTNGPIGWTNEPLCQEAGIIVGRKGAYRGVHYSPDPFFVIDTAYFLRLTSPNVDLKWAYFKLLTVDINRIDVGAAIPTTSRDAFYSVPLDLPPLSTQHRIADMLSAYDNLIENNLRRMALLEESARLLYREWFVRLRFPGHEHARIVNGMPEGWERKRIGDVLTLNYGKALKESDRIEGPFPVYGSSGVVGTHSEAFVKGPGIIVGRKGNVGSVYWAESDFWPIDTVYFIESHQSSYFLFHNLQHQSFLNSDGAVPGLNRNYAYSLPVLFPKQMIHEQFEQMVTPIYEQMSKLRTMNQKLKAARNLLLPRLISGEIAV